MPVLIKNYPVHGFEFFDLEQYEVTLREWKLPEYLNKNDKKILLQTAEIYKQEKEILRIVDKRKMLSYKIVSLPLKSLAEIQSSLSKRN